MVHRTIDNPAQFTLPKERHVAEWIATGVGSAALAGLIVNSLPSDPKFDMKNSAQLVNPVFNEYQPPSDQEWTTPVLPETIQQDEITGFVVEREVLEYANKYNVALQLGQAEVNFHSAKAIEAAVEQVTGGAVYPGAQIETQLDPDTKFIYSKYTPKKSE